MKQTLFENQWIYVPFLNFFEDETDFATLAYPDKKPISGVSVYTITHNLQRAIYAYTIDEAKKIFNKHLKSLCPKSIWKKYGYLKMTYQMLINYQVNYKQDCFGYDYISVDDLFKNFEVISMQ